MQSIGLFEVSRSPVATKLMVPIPLPFIFPSMQHSSTGKGDEEGSSSVPGKVIERQASS
jgi:hypothetical protein